MKELKWGLFLHGTLMQEYSGSDEGYLEAIQAAMLAYKDIGMTFEIKMFSS